MIKKVLAILSMFLLMQTSIFALNIPKQDESIYVNDYAFVLSDTIEQQLVSINQTSDVETGGYVVVATFDFVDEDLYDFSYRLFNEWGIGSKEHNNGVLLVLDIGNDNYCYILGKGLENVLTDSEAWDIIDNYMEPDFAVKNYEQAVLKTTKEFLQVIENSFAVDNEVIPDNNGNEIATGIGAFISALLFGNEVLMWIIFLLIIFIVIRAIIRSRTRRYTYGPTYHRPIFRPSYRKPRDPFMPRPNRDFNSHRHSSFGGGSSFGSRPSSFGGSRPSSFGGSRSHHSGGSSRGAGGTRR